MSGKMPWLQLTVVSAGSMHFAQQSECLIHELMFLLRCFFKVVGLGYALLRGELGY